MLFGASETRVDWLERRLDAALGRTDERVREVRADYWEQGRELNELRWELRRELTDLKWELRGEMRQAVKELREELLALARDQK